MPLFKIWTGRQGFPLIKPSPHIIILLNNNFVKTIHCEINAKHDLIDCVIILCIIHIFKSLYVLLNLYNSIIVFIL